MKKIIFNVQLNEPDQLIHLDVFQPEKGFLVFAHFIGTVLNTNKFKITGINFWIRQTDVTRCIPKEKGSNEPSQQDSDCPPRENQETPIPEEPIYAYPEIQNIKYQDENHPDNEKKVKKISFKFKPSGLEMRHDEEFNTPDIIVRNGEKMYFDLEPVGFEGRQVCKMGSDKNVNGHICNIQFYI